MEMRAERWGMLATEIITVGLPFCVFKLLTALIALQSPSLAPLGYALLVLGSVDAILNVVNLAALVTVRRRASGACVLDVVLRKLRASSSADLGLALDVFLSFALVAVVIGFGLLLRMPSWALPLWNVAVVLNVLGAGIGRLFTALRSDRA